MSETKESSCWILDFVSPFFSGHAHSAAGRQWTLMMPFVRALLGNLSSGCRWVKAVHSFLGFVLEALQREAESRLSLADLELAWGFVSSSVLEPHPTSFVRSPWTHLTAALLLWGIHAEFVCCLNQPRGGMGYILPVRFPLSPASPAFWSMSEAEHFSSKQQKP